MGILTLTSYTSIAEVRVQISVQARLFQAFLTATEVALKTAQMIRIHLIMIIVITSIIVIDIIDHLSSYHHHLLVDRVCTLLIPFIESHIPIFAHYTPSSAKPL